MTFNPDHEEMRALIRRMELEVLTRAEYGSLQDRARALEALTGISPELSDAWDATMRRFMQERGAA